MTKSKVVFIMGATGVGKSKLSIDLATCFDGEIVNSDKIQVYMGLDVVTNKITRLEQRGIPHHLIGIIQDPDADFTQDELCDHAMHAIEKIIERERVPFIVGGSNTFIEALVEDPIVGFKSRYDSCFIWLDASPPVLYGFVSRRVDEMVRLGLVDEVREIYREDADYTCGIRRAIGVREMEPYLKAENSHEQTHCEHKKHQLLRAAINEIKENTCKLTCHQVGKIRRMKEELLWNMMRINATGVFEKSGEEAQEEWNDSVLGPTTAIVGSFLGCDNNKLIATKNY